MINLFSVRSIRKILKDKNILPLKRLGQNFLIKEGTAQTTIQAAELNSKDIVLEIGSGLGTLTKEIAEKAKQVIAIEKDSKMIEISNEVLKEFKNIKTIEDDALSFIKRKPKILNQNYKVIANPPYYIASPIIRMFLELPNPPSLMVLMVQKEVGKRICSEPPRMTKLSVFVQSLAKPKVIKVVKKDSFWPAPKVDSAILKIIPLKKTEKQILDKNEKMFSSIVSAGFSHPRKKLIKNLSLGLDISKEKTEQWLSQNKINSNQRAETLNIDDWLNLTKTFQYKI